MLPISAPAADGHHHDMELLPRTADTGGKSPSTATTPRSSRDKLRCLDGLRGIACIAVFNYHFLWPWTPAVSLGYGAWPPGAPAPYYLSWWLSLPGICLLTRGRPMVAIFFAISGYVLCRHILRAIHERRLEAAYQSLASAVFRRAFRLYIPPTISMFIVAMLAQTGAFRSMEDVYTGPDSAYINGTVTRGTFGQPCTKGSYAIASLDVPGSLGLEDATTLGNMTFWPDTICVNTTSKIFGPAQLYVAGDDAPNYLLNDTMTLHNFVSTPYLLKHRSPPVNFHTGANLTNITDFTWIQMGGSWEEHPFIHDNMTYALQNFSRSYAEWANPFNFGHYHPRYDPHTFTIPMELRGSMVLYIFLLGTAALVAKWRMRFAGSLAAYSLWLGRWDMATFMGGMLLSEMDIRAEGAPASTGRNEKMSPRQAAVLRYGAIALALYLLSYPDAGAEYTPGFIFLSEYVPRYYIPLSGWMFYQAMGALILLACILRDPFLRRMLETPGAQYLGKISFSLYLVHGPVLHCVGFWIMPRLFERIGNGAFVCGWASMMALTLWLADWWYRKVDVWSVSVGKKIERALVME